MSAKPSIDSIFCSAIEIESPNERLALVKQSCGEDANLKYQVERLLHAHFHGRSILDAPAQPVAGVAPSLVEASGALIGPYKLLEPIGEGGFGVVFMAEQQQPIRRRVALKVLKPGMDTRQIVARFEAERQALALMDHPNIAQVFDAGETAAGRPYFVMELVRGIPITNFCDQNRLPIQVRLGLFATVCQAVQHAHHKGIIHRDLKPHNVLVTLHDVQAVVKVIDFGIAKATGQQLTEKTLFTGFAQMMGTPMYMSPEQAQLSGLDVDTRSDVYSLGVLLYELLTGTTPFDEARLRTSAYDEIRRIIREEEPPKPSTRFSTVGQAATTLSANRGSDPRRLRQLVRGELDWIVMKSLEKDRNRRYESASALSADVERYLRAEPVLACPPSSWYRFRKFAGRNKAGLAMATVPVLCLLLAVAALAVSTARIGRALTAETSAKEELNEAIIRERSNFYAYALGLARRDWLAGELEQARHNLDACPEKLRDQEWRRLHRACHAEVRRFQQVKYTGRLLFSPDGKTLACAGVGNLAILSLVDAETGQEQFTSIAVSMADPALWFSPDGQQLIWAGVWRGPLFAVNPSIKGKPNEFALTLWNLENPKQIARVGRVCAGWGRVTLSPDGVRAALVDNKKAIICDARSGQEFFSLAGPIADVQVGPVFHPGGKSLATFGNRTLRFWNAVTGQPTASVAVGGYVRTMAFSPDGRFLVGATGDPSRGPDALTVWDADTGAVVAVLRGHADQVSLLAFSPDGERLATAGCDKTIIIWNVKRGRELLTLRGHGDVILGLAFSPDGRRLASSSSDRTLRIWDSHPDEAE